MDKLRSTYFFKLYALNKCIFIMVFIFLILNFIANTILPTEITPIYNWNLYSQPIKEQKNYQFIQVMYNGIFLKIPQTWKDPQRVLIYNTVNTFILNQIDRKEDYSKIHFQNVWLPNHPYFQRLFSSFTNFPIENDFNRFPSWYKKYLESCLSTQIKDINIYRKTLSYDEKGNVNESSSALIYSIK